MSIHELKLCISPPTVMGVLDSPMVLVLCDNGSSPIKCPNRAVTVAQLKCALKCSE